MGGIPHTVALFLAERLETIDTFGFFRQDTYSRHAILVHGLVPGDTKQTSDKSYGVGEPLLFPLCSKRSAMP